ncbi:MAG: hypothetical protein PHI85_10055 [Victivallaceae bacterium]|nr:hypothetical protein [Victivallaceae bacterium]
MAYTTPVENMTVTGEIIDSGTQVVGNGGKASSCEVMAGAVQTVTSGGVIAGTFGAGSVQVAGGTASNIVLSGGVIYGAGNIDGIALYNDAWAQFKSNVKNVSAFDYAKYEIMDGVANGMLIDASGYDPAVDDGAYVLIMRNGGGGTPAVANLTLQNGGSAHVYDGGLISGCTVKNGGVLYMIDRDLTGIAYDWLGNQVDMNGTLQNCTVEAGGTLYIGGSAATIQNATIKYGAMVDGFSVSQKLIGVKVVIGGHY